MKIARAVLSLTVAAAFCPTILAADWPQWRGPTRNAVSTETGIATDWKTQPPKELWKAKVGTGFSSVAVARGWAFVAGNRDETDTLYAFDAASGEEKWKHAYPCTLGSLRHEGGPYATPTVDGNRVYQLSKIGQLFCLDADTGKVVWQINVAEATGTSPPNYGYSSSPLMAGNLLILNVGIAGAAVDKRTGKVVWKSANAAPPGEGGPPAGAPRRGPRGRSGSGSARPGHASPLAYGIDGQQGVAVLSQGQIVGLNPANGSVLWRQKLPTQGLCYKIADPTFFGDRFLITASYGNFCALFQLKGGKVSQVWEKGAVLSKFLNPVLVDGHVVCGHREKTLRCVELETGDVKWEQDFAGSILLVEGRGLILTTKGDLILADIGPAGYKELTRATVLSGKCWTAPALAGGRVYCRNAPGDVVGVQLPLARQE